MHGYALLFYAHEVSGKIIGVLGIFGNAKDLFPEQHRLPGTIANLTTIGAVFWMGLKVKKTATTPLLPRIGSQFFFTGPLHSAV